MSKIISFIKDLGVCDKKRVLNKVDNGKLVEHDNIPIQLQKCLREKNISWLTKLFNKIMISKKMLGEWRSTLIPIYENNGDIQNCINHKGNML